MTPIPFLDAPEVDCLAALGDFDRAAAEHHEIFARRFYPFEVAPAARGQDFELLNVTVIKRGPVEGLRLKRFIHATDRPVFLPDDFFSLEGLEPLEG